MGITRQYQTYRGMYLDHWTENWGNDTYNHLLYKTYADADAVTTGSSSGSVAISFLYPLLPKNEYYIDGIAEGIFTVKNTGASGTALTDFTISLKKVNIAGGISDLATHQETLTNGNVIAAGTYMAFQFYLTCTKELVQANEKLILVLSITGGSDLRFMHENDSTENDVWIKIPYVPETG